MTTVILKVRSEELVQTIFIKGPARLLGTFAGSAQSADFRVSEDCAAQSSEICRLRRSSNCTQYGDAKYQLPPLFQCIFLIVFLLSFVFDAFWHTPLKSWLCPVLWNVLVAVWTARCRFIASQNMKNEENSGWMRSDVNIAKRPCLWTTFQLWCAING